MFVSVGGGYACVKITGRANCNSSIDFKTLLNELMQQGCTRFILDLSECLLMDSTFLGVLAGFGLRSGPGNPIELCAPNARILELLENLGVIHLFKVVQEPAACDAASTREHPVTVPGKEEVTETCLEAHNILMGIDPSNVARFKDVTRFLAEDLKKLKGR